MKKLTEITDDDGQYDDLRNSQEERMEYISYECLIDNATEPQVVEKNLKGNLDKYYF